MQTSMLFVTCKEEKIFLKIRSRSHSNLLPTELKRREKQKHPSTDFSKTKLTDAKRYEDKLMQHDVY